MRDDIVERCKTLAEYIIKTGCTVREAGKIFAVSKSTVHKDVSERLKYIDENLYNKARKILEVNFSERHLRGGIATKKKYEKIKSWKK